MARLSQNTLAG